jgi:anti-anti-sigma regulatory factor
MPQQHPDDARQTEVVFLPRVINMISADQVRANLAAAVHTGAAVVLADLSATISCDCEGAYSLAQAHRDAAAADVELRLVAPPPVVLRMLALLGLKDRVPAYPSLDEALPPPPDVPMAPAPADAATPPPDPPAPIPAQTPGRHEASRRVSRRV